MIHFSRVGSADKKYLHDLLQQYLCEMSKYCEISKGEDGLYEYRYFEDYFSDGTRKALFILEDNATAGFVLLNRHSCINETPDHAVAEFYILPEYRKKRIAMQAFDLLCRAFPGRWEIKYSTKNIPAARFWTRASKPCNPSVRQLPDDEIVLSFDTNPTP